jgi:TetR/AcrR family transcriptional repressor of nem operon
MARNKEFDREEALKKALDVFWLKGYAAASTDDLLQAMQIGRQSMYDTFGDKRKLYLEALRRYNADNIGEFLHNLRSQKDGSPLAGLQNALYKFAGQPAANHRRGCMGVNAVCEFGPDDTDVAQINEISGMSQSVALAHLIADAKKHGELSAGIDEQAAGDFIAAILIGMKIKAKLGASEAKLRHISDIALAGLKAM